MVGKEAAPGWGIISTPLPLGEARPDHDRQAAHSDAVEQIVLEFDEPQTISRLVYEVEEQSASVHRKYASRSPRMKVELIGRFWFRNTTSVRRELLTSPKNNALTS